ncbi:MAG: hypothetical protein EX271_08500 [Acidimicrobiales bacterium]|nr:sulfatase-like hydrolase/transferase [Hyphomonadaceae bacterium]RZV41213.1 MAG: hypothetical protein EX271_08500 [Acidimicrobiales bacterium]
MVKPARERDDFFVLQSHWHYHLIILASGFLIFLFVPLFILTPGQAKQTFNNGREIQVVLDILILVGIFTLVSSIIYWLFSFMKRCEIAASLVRFLFCWVALSGFLFPLTTNNGMFELISSPTHKLNLMIVLILSLGLTVIWGSKYARTVTIFLATFLAIAIAPTFPKSVSQFEKQSGEAHQLPLSSQKNLLLIGMDGVPGHIVADLFQENPALAENFKDFTFYTNVASTSPATDASLMGIMYGNHDFTRWTEPFPIDWRSLYFNNAEKYNLYTGQKFNTYNEKGTKLSAGRYGVAEQRNELFEMYRNVAVRIFAKPGVNALEVIDERYFPNRGGKFYSTVKGFDTVVNSLQTGSDKPTILFSHFTFTHWPVSMGEDCILRKMDKRWMAENSNKAGVIKGVKCGLDKYSELIDTLKSIGVYDNTDIVFFSDHGKPVLYYNEPPHNFRINGNRDFGFDRYQPFLMIKPAGNRTKELAYSDRIVILDDLAQTLCYIMEPSDKCESTPGVNILDSDDSAPDRFFIHVVKDVTSRWFLQEHKAVSLSREVPLEAAMQASPEIVLREAPKN